MSFESQLKVFIKTLLLLDFLGESRRNKLDTESRILRKLLFTLSILVSAKLRFTLSFSSIVVSILLLHLKQMNQKNCSTL